MLNYFLNYQMLLQTHVGEKYTVTLLVLDRPYTSANFFYKGPSRKYFPLYGSYGHCHNYLTLPL